MSLTQIPGKQIGDELKNADIASDAAIERSKLQLISALTEKTTPVDADVIEGADSAASNASKKFTWANIKATLKTYFDGLYRVKEVTYSQLTTLISADELIPGQRYLITDFATVHTIIGTSDTNTGTTEPLIVTANGVDTLEKIAESTSFPQDIIYYDVTNNTSLLAGSTKGVIYRRIDVQKNIDIGLDWRNVKFRRWQISVSTEDATGAVGNYLQYEVVKKTGTTTIYVKLNDLTAKPFTDTSSWKRFEFADLEYGSPSETSWSLCGVFLSIPCSALYMDYKMFTTVPTAAGVESAYTNIYSIKIESSLSNILAYNSTIFFGTTVYNLQIGAACYGNSIVGTFSNNIIGNDFNGNSIKGSFYSNIIGDQFEGNSIQSYSSNNKIGNVFWKNLIGNYFQNNQIADNFGQNRIAQSFVQNIILARFEQTLTPTEFYCAQVLSNIYQEDFSNFATTGVTGFIMEGNLSGNLRIFYLNSNSELVIRDITGNVYNVIPKATGAEINSGTDDAKYVTAKGIADSNIAFTSDIPTSTSGLTDSTDKRFCTDAQKTVIGNTSGTNTGDSSTPAETTATIGTLINGATAKATPVDADLVGFADTEASNVLKKLTWTNIKAFLKTYFDTLYALLASPTFTGTVTLPTTVLGETSFQLDPAISADGKWSGITETGVAGATLVFGNLCYCQTADSRWKLASADNAAAGHNLKLGICLLAAAGDGSATEILLIGKVNAASLYPTLTIGAPVYMSTTAGTIQVVAPTGTTDVVRKVGYANTADELFFNPSTDYIELV